MSNSNNSFQSLSLFTGVRPYSASGKSNLGFTQKKTGVYIIREKMRGQRYKTVYIGHSTGDLYKTISRHFQDWNDKEQPERVTYKKFFAYRKYIVQIGFCHAKQVLPLEAALIEKYQPRDNTSQMQFNLTDRGRELAKTLIEMKPETPKPQEIAPF
jgi:hypothetical protein